MMAIMDGWTALRLARELVSVLEHAERDEASFQDLAEARLCAQHVTGDLEEMMDAMTHAGRDRGGSRRMRPDEEAVGRLGEDGMELLLKAARRGAALALLIGTLTDSERARLERLARGWPGPLEGIPRGLVRACLDRVGVDDPRWPVRNCLDPPEEEDSR
jgi:hypothetical protein